MEATMSLQSVIVLVSFMIWQCHGEKYDAWQAFQSDEAYFLVDRSYPNPERTTCVYIMNRNRKHKSRRLEASYADLEEGNYAEEPYVIQTARGHGDKSIFNASTMAVAKGTVFTFKLEFVDSITGCLVVKRIPDLAPGVAGCMLWAPRQHACKRDQLTPCLEKYKRLGCMSDRALKLYCKDRKVTCPAPCAYGDNDDPSLQDCS